MGLLDVCNGQPPNAFWFSYAMEGGSHPYTPAPERFTLHDNGVVTFLADKQIHHGKLENSSFLTFLFILFYLQDPQFLCHEGR